MEHRDALIQILASLDRDKNSSVGMAGSSLVVMKRARSGFFLIFFFFIYIQRLPIKLASERLMVGLVVFFFFFFFLLDDQLDLPVKETPYWCVRDFCL